MGGRPSHLIFLELRKGEVRRIYLLGTSVNRGKERRAEATTPQPSSTSPLRYRCWSRWRLDRITPVRPETVAQSYKCYTVQPVGYREAPVGKGFRAHENGADNTQIE